MRGGGCRLLNSPTSRASRSWIARPRRGPLAIAISAARISARARASSSARIRRCSLNACSALRAASATVWFALDARSCSLLSWRDTSASAMSGLIVALAAP
jgi:hypothetical protein